MTQVPPMSVADTDERGLGSLIDSFVQLGDDDATFVRILAHAPGYAEAIWGAMAEALFNGNVDHSLKEMIRIQLATHAADPYFSSLRSKQAIAEGLTEDRIRAALGDFENDDRFTPAEKWALSYAHRMYRTPETVDAAFYDAGKELMSEAQIMEIGGLVAIHYGMQVFMRTLQG
ncbi:MAG: carboxymuconolactone decarboxylase family protein [Acidimicrobiales bacterium]